jgi:hypothetical protein
VAIVLKSGSLNLLETSGPVQACNGIALSLCKRDLYFKDIATVYKNRFELQPEDGFIKSRNMSLI